jgi:UDP-N-acetylmuramoyl-L-alanyl-D-glutamate--2,6-diaminopimelate ligase
MEDGTGGAACVECGRLHDRGLMADEVLPEALTLPELVARSGIQAALVGSSGEVVVSHLTSSSKHCRPGSLFCCIRGSRLDGHDFAEEAVERGAVALVTTRRLDARVPQVVVSPGSERSAMAGLAAALWGRPAERLTMVGVTGTNGKTTVTHMIASILEASGVPTAVLGTLSGSLTTPDSPDLQEALARFLASGKRAVAMEVSSHGLATNRVDAITFDVAVFTNLGHDHLDFHGSMEEYFEAKAQLFTPGRARQAVVNRDDPWGRALLERAAVPIHPFSMADASEVSMDPGGARFFWRGVEVVTHMLGSVNVANALAAATTAEVLGLDKVAIASGLASLPVVPGRLERVATCDGVVAYVDFAHTPEALSYALAAVREATGRSVVVVFGCGGDRDPSKRPDMGRIASESADYVVVTSDNPRSEDPVAIIDDVVSGVPAHARARLLTEVDRRAAITAAIEIAKSHTPCVLLVAGKGHETGQDFGSVVLPFDDREVVRALLLDSGGEAA